ncbi:MAG: CHASE2 domain-containing protein [Ignavibacteriae bacterium]|nr:CHASE2 domain-containing protein [Ignavibacteriota bacterium]
MLSGLPKTARGLIAYCSIILTVTVVVLFLTEDIFLAFPPLKRAELSLLDLRFQHRGIHRGNSDSSIVIVEISQESFKSLPERWPWPKSYYTRLVRNLKHAGAAVIGIDVIFSASDPRDSANERQLRDVLREAGNVVLAGSIDARQLLYTKRERTENYGNIYIDSLARFGLVNIRPDVDGILRRYMPIVYDAGRDERLPAFSISVLNTYFQQSRRVTPEVADHAFHFASREIPKYDASSFLINYTGPSGVFQRINVADVLDDKEFQTIEELNHPGEEINTFDDTTLIPSFDGRGLVPAGYLYNGTFQGKIVLIGSTMPEDKDLFPVPIGEGRQEGDNQMFGVEVHANVLRQILDRDFIRHQPLWMTVLIVIGLSAITFSLTAGLKSIRTPYSALIEILGIAVVVSEIIIVYWATVKLFVSANFLADMMSAFLAVTLSYVGSTVYHYVTERKQKVLIKGMFSRYVNATIVDELVLHPEKLRLGGERKELTVLFSDIENFTQISERVSPEYLITVLNEYLNVMTAIIFGNQGTLDKYEGDAILAFWGAPVPQQDHALRACRAAMEMQQALAALREMWKAERKPLFNVRIGINTGDMIVGNMGGASRFDYTVIGDSVNLGSRLEGANKQYKTGIMISEHTYRSVEGSVVARELDLVLVAGKTEPIRVYELLGMANDSIPTVQRQALELYNNGLRSYREREWQRAIDLFEKALMLTPNDYPAQLYIERSRLYYASPPPAGWNGVFVLQSK